VEWGEEDEHKYNLDGIGARRVAGGGRNAAEIRPAPPTCDWLS